MYTRYKDKILSFYQQEKRMPDYTEMMKLLGFKSKNAVFKLVQKLVEVGVVKKDAKGKLIPTRVLGEIPLLGLVEAGFPSVAEEEALDMLSIDEYLIEHKEASYLLEVKGDSMIEAGIQEGDLVIAERKGEARDGDIVIAEVDGGWTMKYYRLPAQKGKKGRPYLQPANKNYKNIYPESELNVAAIVKGVIRKY